MYDVSRELHGSMIVDCVGRCERLQEDFNTVCDRIDIPRMDVPHARRAVDRDDCRQYHDDTTAALVAEHYAAHIERPGYRFDGPATDEYATR